MSAHRPVRIVAAAAVALLMLLAGTPGTASSSVISPFQESVVWSGLTHPTVVRFSPDGRVLWRRRTGGFSSSTR